MESTPADGRNESNFGPVGNDGGIIGELPVHRDPRAGEECGHFGMTEDQSLQEVRDRRAVGQGQRDGSHPRQFAGPGEQLDDHGAARMVVGAEGIVAKFAQAF